MHRTVVAALTLLAGIWAAAAFPACAVAQKRVALVVGNSAYQHTSPLINPKNDAADVAAALKRHGFHVIEGLDLDKAAFDRKVRDFAVALKEASAGVFFYAGHGLQVAGQNYLVPVDAKADSEEALDFEMLKVDIVHRAMERSTNTNVLFLDACRDNPLARNLSRAMGTRSTQVGKGLATVESGVGTLISFSTQPGNVALDGSGRNSPFAGALVKHLSSSNDDLSALLIAVRNDVMTETQRKQVPWEHSALTGRFYFSPGNQTANPAKVAPTRLSEAAEAWGATKDATNVAVLEAFISRYKETFYAELARSRMEELKKQQVAVAKSEPLRPSAVDASTDRWSPTKPITLIVPFAPGGASDALARTLASEMQSTLGQPLVITNVPGAGGTVGAAQTAAAQADGYTIMVHAAGLAATPSLYASPQFETRTAFDPIGLINSIPLVVVSSKGVQAKSLPELVDWMKANAANVTIGHAGPGTSSHACALLLQDKLGKKFSLVAHVGTGPAVAALASGSLNVMCDPIASMAQPIKTGTVKAHAVLASARVRLLPDVPTSREAGLPDLQMALYSGLYAPARTPKNAIQALNASLQRALAQKSVLDNFASIGAEPFAPAMRSPEAHAKFFAADIDLQARLFKAADVKPR